MLHVGARMLVLSATDCRRSAQRPSQSEGRDAAGFTRSRRDQKTTPRPASPTWATWAKARALLAHVGVRLVTVLRREPGQGANHNSCCSSRQGGLDDWRKLRRVIGWNLCCKRSCRLRCVPLGRIDAAKGPVGVRRPECIRNPAEVFAGRLTGRGGCLITEQTLQS